MNRNLDYYNALFDKHMCEYPINVPVSVEKDQHENIGIRISSRCLSRDFWDNFILLQQLVPERSVRLNTGCDRIPKLETDKSERDKSAKGYSRINDAYKSYY